MKKKETKKETSASKVPAVAVVKLGGSQVMVKENTEVTVDNIRASKGDKLTIKDVLVVINGSDVKVGKPILDDWVVQATVTSVKKGKKIEGLKYKAKARYRKRFGARPILTRISIDKISQAKA